MDCTSANRGLSLGRGSALPHPRSGPDLWQRRHAPIARHGHPGQAYRASLALAEWLCRTADRIDPARVRRSYDCPGRGASASDSEILRPLLQSCFITPICLCDWREEALLIWVRSRGVIWVLPRATNEALSHRFAER